MEAPTVRASSRSPELEIREMEQIPGCRRDEYGPETSEE